MDVIKQLLVVLATDRESVTDFLHKLNFSLRLSE